LVHKLVGVNEMEVFMDSIWTVVVTYPNTSGLIIGSIIGIILNIDEIYRKKEEEKKVLNVRIVQ
jgi:adenine/guanine phosphoribosyltransferase-like PRPP-binding protein